MVRYLTVLGTQSHVGKSILVTALCRILKRMGYRVAPFKAQNMSNNSWITADGSEIGIAQAIQAFAAGAEPCAEMNPVLLKPKGNLTSQIVVMGKPLGDRLVGQYYGSIEAMMAIALNALEKLSMDYDVIIIEGAGGAAEINLYDRDIANIPLARAIRSPVLLVGDIERGGVFASLYGTIELLPPGDRSLIKGMIINKFCGDPSLLGSGVRDLEKLTGVPVMGIVPYAKLNIPDEDSVSIDDKRPGGALDLDIAIVRFPLISNFTDFKVLERLARVRYVSLDGGLGRPDVVILPGSKNTVSDLKAVKASPIFQDIYRLADEGVPVLGICGGYQMLGTQVIDSGIEGGSAETIRGLGLLPVTTVFDRYEKCTRQCTKRVTAGGPILGSIRGSPVTGYEIHMGQTQADIPAFEDDGCVNATGNVIGTYLHGIFENPCVVDAVIRYACERKGIEYVPADILNDPYDDLADLVSSVIDLDAIIGLIEAQRT